MCAPLRIYILNSWRWLWIRCSSQKLWQSSVINSSARRLMSHNVRGSKLNLTPFPTTYVIFNQRQPLSLRRTSRSSLIQENHSYNEISPLIVHGIGIGWNCEIFTNGAQPRNLMLRGCALSWNWNSCIYTLHSAWSVHKFLLTAGWLSGCREFDCRKKQYLWQTHRLSGQAVCVSVINIVLNMRLYKLWIQPFLFNIMSLNVCNRTHNTVQHS